MPTAAHEQEAMAKPQEKLTKPALLRDDKQEALRITRKKPSKTEPHGENAVDGGSSEKLLDLVYYILCKIPFPKIRSSFAKHQALRRRIACQPGL